MLAGVSWGHEPRRGIDIERLKYLFKSIHRIRKNKHLSSIIYKLISYQTFLNYTDL